MAYGNHITISARRHSRFRCLAQLVRAIWCHQHCLSDPQRMMAARQLRGLKGQEGGVHPAWRVKLRRLTI